VAVAGKPGVERDRREVVAAVENGLERTREALPHDIVVDGRTDHLTEDVT
jgi:hypothetical protein